MANTSKKMTAVSPFLQENKKWWSQNTSLPNKG